MRLEARSVAQRDSADSERDYVEAARRGDRGAFEHLYREHSGRVYGLCLRLTREPAIAEDCTQETFVSAWRSLPAFEGRSAFGTWLHRIAVNAALARGRRGQLEGIAAATEDEPDERATAPAADDSPPLDVEAAIEGLPPGARQVLLLYGIYGYTHEEAAGMLGIAVGTCKAQLHRARQLLRTRLNGQDS